MPARSAGVSPLPCLSSNNCTEHREKLPDETPDETAKNLHELQGNHKKTAALLAWTIATLALVHGIQRLGFLTLTFAENVTSPKEAQRRFHSLKTHVLNKRFAAWVRVFERQKNGRIHYHLLVVLRSDVRTGFDFSEAERGIYRSANHYLRQEWAFWRKTAPLYRFGRTEMLPVKSTAEGISRYVGKYISKHIGNRIADDKGVRLAEFSQGARIGTTRFAWHSVGRWCWSQKLQALGGALGAKDMDDLRRYLGQRWAFRFARTIFRVELHKYPSIEHARRDGRDVDGLPADATDLEYSTFRDGRVTAEEAAGLVIQQLLNKR